MLKTIFGKLQECVKKNTLNFSSIREEVLKEIELSEKALCSEEIYKRVNQKSQPKESTKRVKKKFPITQFIGF